MALTLTRYAPTLGYLVATDNTYSLPPQSYASNIASQMTQSQNFTALLTARSASPLPSQDANSWLIEPSAPANVGFNTFDDTTQVAGGLAQQMINATNAGTNNAYWGVYFGAIPGQGQNAGAYGKIQVYGTTVTGLGGDGDNPNNTTSLAALQALFLKIGNKYQAWGGFISAGDIENSFYNAQSAGVMVSLNGCIVYGS
jgi:hypothetical protein